MIEIAKAQPLRWQRAVIAEIIPLTARVRSFVFTLSEPFSFQAGQHVDVVMASNSCSL